MKVEPGVAAIVLAAGNGSRVGAAHNKVFLPLAGRKVVSWSLRALAQVTSITRFLLVIREADLRLARETMERELDGIDVELVIGGQNRHQSELFALRHLAPAIGSGAVRTVLIHDGARPLLAPRLVRTLISAVSDHGAVIPGMESADIFPIRGDGSLDLGQSQRIIRVQTPQAFEAEALLHAYERAAADRFVGTDTASCWQQYQSKPVQSVRGDERNIKVTYPDDLFLADSILRSAHFQLD